MRPDFAKVIDPILLATMHFAERMGNNDRLVASNVRANVEKLLDDAEITLGANNEWKLSKYALCALIDALFISAPWSGNAWWKDNCLEKKYFGERLAHEDFFKRSLEANELSRKDALEVYYLAVVLGFRGFYADSNASYRDDLIERLRLPASIESWCAQTARSLQLKQGRPGIGDNIQVGSGARPLSGRNSLITFAILGTLFFGCAIATAILVFDLGQLIGGMGK